MAKYIKTEQGYQKIETIVAPMVGEKMDKINPTGTGSFSLNRKANTTIGVRSFAEGDNTTASGRYSHAEGSDTTASGTRSHAEGQSTTASGAHSHAEGNYTTASGQSSHAEGFFTKASGVNQHAQGKYNIEDSAGTYADIIGNGTSSKRSNAATVDWSGNAWYAGDVYVGSTSGTNKDAGSKKLATEEYVSTELGNYTPDPSLGITNATVGQIAKITAVDSNGKPTAWEPVDMASGGGGGGDVFEKIVDITLAEDVAEVNITQDADGNTFSLKKVYIRFVPAYGSDKTTSGAFRINYNEGGVIDANLDLTRTISVLLYIDEVYAIESTHYDAATGHFDTYAIKTQLLSRTNEGQPISYLKLAYPTVTYYAGTKITVYGVRA